MKDSGLSKSTSGIGVVNATLVLSVVEKKDGKTRHVKEDDTDKYVNRTDLL